MPDTTTLTPEQQAANLPPEVKARVLTLADGESREVTRTWPDGAWDCPYCTAPSSAASAKCENPGCTANMTADQLAATRQRHAAEDAHREEADRIQRFNYRMRLESAQAEDELWEDLAREAAERGACVTCLRNSHWRSGRENAKFVRHRTSNYHDN